MSKPYRGLPRPRPCPQKATPPNGLMEHAGIVFGGAVALFLLACFAWQLLFVLPVWLWIVMGAVFLVSLFGND